MDDVRNESKKYGGGNGGNFEFENKGVYSMRLLVQPKVVATHFFGPGQPSHVCVGIDEGCTYHKDTDKKPSIKLATYILDRNDESKIKMAELPLSISYAINDLQEDTDFAFSEFPMPYDVKITYDPDNSDPKAKYRLAPSPKFEAITAEQQKELDERMSKQTPEQYVEKKKAREKEKASGVSAPAASSGPGIDYPKDDINPADIPF